VIADATSGGPTMGMMEAPSHTRREYPISDVIISPLRDSGTQQTLARKFPPNHFAGAAFFLLSGTQHSDQTRTGRTMSDLARTQRRAPTLSCPRCGTAMEAIVTIEPTLGEPGLIGYECPKCVYVTSELVQPTGGAKPVR